MNPAAFADRGHCEPSGRVVDFPLADGLGGFSRFLMIVLQTPPFAHYIGDFAAWSAASIAGWWQHRRWPDHSRILARITSPTYYAVLALFALAGAWLAGSLNSMPISLAPSHGVAGAPAGGVLGCRAVEIV